jgi:hypothetical protein
MEEGFEWEDAIVNMDGVIVIWLIGVVAMMVLTVVGAVMKRGLTSFSSDYKVRYSNWLRSNHQFSCVMHLSQLMLYPSLLSIILDPRATHLLPLAILFPIPPIFLVLILYSYRSRQDLSPLLSRPLAALRPSPFALCIYPLIYLRTLLALLVPHSFTFTLTLHATLTCILFILRPYRTRSLNT